MYCEKKKFVQYLGNRSQEGRWILRIVTCEFIGKDLMTPKELDVVLYNWSRMIEESLGTHDVAYLLNRGNIFLILQANTFNHFQSTVSKTTMVLPSKVGGVATRIVKVKENEADFYLSVL